MIVNFYASLRQVVGAKSLDFSLNEGATVWQLVEEMIRVYPALKRELLNEQGELYRHVHIIVNGMDASLLENGMESVLSLDDTISVFPAVGGG
jgi:molybdopterin synthase sulfur carrier subunit